ncbi:MAG: phage tail assembly protein [Caldilinea sp. CFX5]|nr:phage tail assembly protein [Caldilinea sp. CFX5]
MNTVLQTEFPFTLPRGYIDNQGNLHREGIMRLATAGDEILPLKDPRVQTNPAYLVIIVLSRVITRLGSLSGVNPQVVEGLFAADLSYLQDFYNRINNTGTPLIKVVCPRCDHKFEMEMTGAGEV